MADYFGALDSGGGAVADLFGAKGSQAAGSAYGTAATIAKQNEATTIRSTAIQEQQQGIQAYKVLGSESADVSGAGFTAGGSAGDLMRSSAQQASLSKQLIQNQGDITAGGYEEQANAYLGQKQAAETQATGQGIGGIFKMAASALSLFSDRRLKENIEFIRKDGKFNIYRFQYIGTPEVFEGVMADEVREIVPEAVQEMSNGFLAVDYNMIDQRMVYRGR